MQSAQAHLCVWRRAHERPCSVPHECAHVAAGTFIVGRPALVVLHETTDVLFDVIVADFRGGRHLLRTTTGNACVQMTILRVTAWTGLWKTNAARRVMLGSKNLRVTAGYCEPAEVLLVGSEYGAKRMAAQPL